MSSDLQAAVRGSGAWPGLRLVEPVGEGHRTEVWSGELDGERVAVRRSRRGTASLEWELDVLDVVAAAGVGVAAPVPADLGRRSVGGVVVQRWVDGRPPSSHDDWNAVAQVLRRVHSVAVEQRPGACAVTELAAERRSVDADVDALPPDVASLVLDVFATFGDVGTSLIHGDPGPSNIRIDDMGRAWLLDWDESRVDISWHDLSNLGIEVLDGSEHRRATVLSHAWEAVNAWTVEPAYARTRLAALRRALPGDGAI